MIMFLKYRPDIDGLRAIAVLSVIVFHLNSHWLHGGFIGVDIFFVISGYLITKIIYTDIINHQFSFKVFYQRRINRILPVFFVVMFTTAFVAWYMLLPDDFMLFLKSLKSTTYFWENMFFAQNTGGYWDKSAETMPILHTWSLAVEEQFYIFFPFVLLLLIGIRYQTKTKLIQLSRNNILFILAVVALVSFSLAQLSPKSLLLSKYNYYSLVTGRAGELLIGGIIGILSVQQSSSDNNQTPNLFIKNCLSITGFLMMVLSIIFLSEKRLFPSFWAIIPTVGTALVISCYDKRTVIAKLLSIKPLVFIGTISYSLYLWHWPIIVLTKLYLFVDNLTTIIQYLGIIILIIGFSLFSFYLVERPCRKHRRSFKFSFFTYYLIPFVIIGGGYYVQNKTQFLNFRYSSEQYKDYVDLNTEALNDAASDKCNSQFPNWTKFTDNPCNIYENDDQDSIAIIGDSHAGHLYYGLRRNLKNGVLVFPASCALPFYNMSDTNENDPYFQVRYKNTELINSAYDYVIKNEKITTVFLAHHPNCSFNFAIDINNKNINNHDVAIENGMRRSLSMLTESGKKVILVKDNPALPFDPYQCVIKMIRTGNKECSFDANFYKNNNVLSDYNNIIDKVLLDYPKVSSINLADYLCDKDKCYIATKSLLYQDRNHLNNNGSNVVVKKMIPYLEKLGLKKR